MRIKSVCMRLPFELGKHSGPILRASFLDYFFDLLPRKSNSAWVALVVGQTQIIIDRLVILALGGIEI